MFGKYQPLAHCSGRLSRIHSSGAGKADQEKYFIMAENKENIHLMANKQQNIDIIEE